MGFRAIPPESNFLLAQAGGGEADWGAHGWGGGVLENGVPKGPPPLNPIFSPSRGYQFTRTMMRSLGTTVLLGYSPIGILPWRRASWVHRVVGLSAVCSCSHMRQRRAVISEWVLQKE